MDEKSFLNDKLYLGDFFQMKINVRKKEKRKLNN